MKRAISCILLVCFFCAGRTQEMPYQKIFFSNSLMEGNYFYSEVTYRAPSWIKNISGKMPVCDTVFFTAGNSLQLKYVSGRGGNWQAGIIAKPGRGIDHFRSSTLLEMRLYADQGTTAAQLPLVAIRASEKDSGRFIPIEKYIDSFATQKWVVVKVPLADFNLPPGLDHGDFNAVLFRQGQSDGKEHSLFIDQVELSSGEQETTDIIPEIISARGYEKHVDITWKPVADEKVKYIQVYRSDDGQVFFPVGIQSPTISRYTDYVDTTGKTFYYRVSVLDNQYHESPFSGIKSAKTFYMSDEQLLDMVQEANFRYYWEGAEPVSGLALENIHGRRNMIATGASGFGIMALIAGEKRKFITHDDLLDRLEKIISFLEQADKFHGAFSHFIDGTTGKTIAFFGTKDNGADLVETSFMMQGLLTAKQYLDATSTREKNLRTRIGMLWKNVEWDWFKRDSSNNYLLWHWSPDQGWVINHKLTGWNETMITYVLAISSRTHGVPADLYYQGWARQTTEARDYRKNWSQSSDGSMYTNGHTYYGIPLKVGVSNGGPLFFIHYSFLGLDPHLMEDIYTNYFINNRNIALINYRYCIENPMHHRGYSSDAWGLTASDGLWNYSADEPVPHADHGKITPTGALASFPYTPTESMAALKNYYRNYGKFAWGEYGFRDAFNLDENWCSDIFMGLNQAPVTVMIENYRSGLLWRLFMSNWEIMEAVMKIKHYSNK